MSSKNLGTSLVDDDENEELLVIDDEDLHSWRQSLISAVEPGMTLVGG